MNALLEVERFVPWDIEIARYNFGANCGPIAFAVAMKLEVCDVMQFFPHFAFENMRWTNATHMRAALASAGVYSERIDRSFPDTGLALVQWLGPWTERNYYSRQSLRYTHWVAVDNGHIYDPNAGQWLSFKDWDETFAPACVQEIARASGWSVKYGFATISSHTICPSASGRSVMGRDGVGPNSRFNFRPRTF